MSNIIIDLFSSIGSIGEIIGYAITDIGIILSIIFNPYLLLMCVIVLANVYVVIKAQTRKDLVLGYGSFFVGFAKMVYSIITATIPVVMGIISAVGGIISGVMSAPPVTVLGTGVAPGTLLALAVMVLLILYSVVSIV